MKTFTPTDCKATRSSGKTEEAIRDIRDIFQIELAEKLGLLRITAPLFAEKSSGSNGNLNGVERPVAFETKEEPDEDLRIVHSLTKWKRFALERYGFKMGEGLFTNMNAIRRDEDTDNLYSIYVDQWDWEKVIAKEDRTAELLKKTVKDIYSAMKITGRKVTKKYGGVFEFPEGIYFVTSEELEARWSELTAKEREDRICEEYKAVLVMHVGDKLSLSGGPYGLRTPDYDDWKLNGDLLFWNPVLKCAFEVSSMGIRVDEEALKRQLTLTDTLDRLELPFYKMLMDGELPYTIGGGTGQPRFCMLFSKKAHIGEVQVSVWPEETIKEREVGGIHLL